jgi:hypothetical protein
MLAAVVVELLVLELVEPVAMAVVELVELITVEPL